MTASLLIYDQDSVATTQIEAVCRQLGMTTYVAERFNDALALAKDTQPHFICSDLLMDEGVGFIWQARSVIERPWVPAVLSAYRALSSKEHQTLYELRAELMLKPLLPQRITSMIYQLEGTLAHAH
ncbi:MAG: hypothetical protein O3A01_01180 [bacterium]|nr:hypothetical protein [bacterium]